MSNLWEAPNEIKETVKGIKEQYHEHLSLARIWVLATDANHVRDNHIIVTKTAKCTRTEKLSTNNDFKITIYMEAWSHLTDTQRDVAIDEALCRCGVKYLPQTVEMNGKKQVVKDDLGRTIYTDDIAYEEDGTPKWKMIQPDATLFYDLISRHGGKYNEEAENSQRAFDGKELIRPMIADRADIIEEAENMGVPV